MATVLIDIWMVAFKFFLKGFSSLWNFYFDSKKQLNFCVNYFSVWNFLSLIVDLNVISGPAAGTERDAGAREPQRFAGEFFIYFLYIFPFLVETIRVDSRVRGNAFCRRYNIDQTPRRAPSKTTPSAKSLKSRHSKISQEHF